MKSIRCCLRRLLWLVLGCGLSGLPMFSQAQTVTVTPPAPEAYQPFTLEWFECSISDRLYEPVFEVSVEAHTILGSMQPQESCSDASQVLRKKVANIRGLPGGTYRILVPGDGGFIVVPPPVEVGSFTVSFPPPTSLEAVAELRNRTTLHYFLTASEDEQTLLQGGGDGDWYYIDFFYAWSAYGPAPAAAKPVCRFYSSAVNSHFYTAGANECELLKQPGSGWTYEGIAFRALVPTKGVCYPGTSPVWRLYNNRFAQLDSNHRFVTSADTYWHMMANGWIGEGVVFCVLLS